MKKILALLVCATMVIGLTACGGNKVTENTQPAEGDNAGQEMYIGVAFPTLASEFYSDIADRIVELGNAQGAKVDVMSCELDSNVQMQQIENFATMGITHLIIQSYDMESMIETLKKTRASGIYVASFGVAPSDLESVDIIPGCIDSYALGGVSAKLAAEWIDETFPGAPDGSIEVAVISNTSISDTAVRSEGMQTIAEYSAKAKVVGSYDLIGANDSTTKAQEFIDIMMEEHPNIKCVVAYDAASAIGANEAAMRNAKINPAEFGIFGCDFTTTMAELIAQSETDASVLRGAVKQGDDMAQMLIDAVNGKLDSQIDPETKAYNMDLYPISIHNLTDYYSAG